MLSMIFHLQEEGWAVCRVFKKKLATTMRREGEHESLCWYNDDQVSNFMPDFDSPRRFPNPYSATAYHNPHLAYTNNMQQPPNDAFLQLPQLESPKVPQSYGSNLNQMVLPNSIYNTNNNYDHQAVDQVTDWRVLDKFVASQLSQEDGCSKMETSAVACSSSPASEQMNLQLQNDFKSQEMASELASSSQVDLWK